MQLPRFPLTLRLLGVLLFALGQIADAEMDLPRLAKQTRPSVVLVKILDRYGRELAQGTAFYVGDGPGYLLTNRHVIEHPKCEGLQIHAHDGATISPQKIIVSRGKADLAFILIEDQAWLQAHLGSPLKCAPLGLKEEAGQRVAVIGSPLGLEGTLSDGIISAVRAEAGEPTLFQITAPISPGSSGSPVLNENGEVLGVATWTHRGGQSLNFAVSREAIRFLDEKETAWETPLTHMLRLYDERSRDEGYQAAWDALSEADRKKAKAKLAAVKKGVLPTREMEWEQSRAASKDAIAMFERLREKYPNEGTICRLLGEIYRDQGDFQASARVYKAALAIYPHDHGVLARIGDVFRDSGDVEKAEEFYRSAVAKAKVAADFERKSDDLESAVLLLVFLAECHEKLGDLSTALAECNEACEHSKDGRSFEWLALKVKARLYARMGEEERALGALLDINGAGKTEQEKRVEAYRQMAGFFSDIGNKDRCAYWWQRCKREEANARAKPSGKATRNFQPRGNQ
jgi:serine protease Do